MVEIHDGIYAVDIALYIEEFGMLVFSDFHMGYEEKLTSRGALIPRFQFKDTIARLDGVFNVVGGVETIVINGDVKNEFGSISTQEWRDVLKLFDYLAEKCEKIIIVKGNHDTMIGPIARKRSIEVRVDYKIGDVLIAHGDTISGKDKLKGVKVLLIGHDHPALGVREHRRVEMVKCFLKGTWKRKVLIVQPSFNVVVEGTDVLQGKFLSPYLSKGVKNFEVFVALGGEVLAFGKVGNIE
jgi:uncharacterized protein